MGGFSDDEVTQELVRRHKASLDREASMKPKPQFHLSGKECIHCHQPLLASDRPPLCSNCLHTD